MRTFVLGVIVLGFEVALLTGFFICGVLLNRNILNNPALWIGLLGSLGTTLNRFIANRNKRKRDIAENYIPGMKEPTLTE